MQLPVPIVESTTYGQRVVFFRNWLVKLLFLTFLGIGSAHAFVSEWETQSNDFTQQTGDKTFDCGSCHSEKVFNPGSLKMTAPAQVAFDKSEVDLEIEGLLVSGKFDYWQYQIVGGAGNLIKNARTNTKQTIPFTTGDDKTTVRYCLLDVSADSSQRRWNCGSVDVTRAPAPDAPPEITSANPGNQTLTELGAGFSFSVTATDDVSVPTLQVTSSNTAVVGVTPGSPGSYTLNPLTVGNSTITIKASDGAGASATQSFVITVQSGIITNPTDNIPPTLSLDNVISGALPLTVGDIHTIGVTATDDKPESLTFATSSSNTEVAAGSFSAPGTLTIDAKGIGSAKITLTVTDADLLQASVSVDVTVSSGNAAPVARPDTFVIGVQSGTVALDVLANDSDSNGDALSIVLDASTSLQGNGITVSGGKVSYQVNGALRSNDVFNYRAKDSSGALSDSVLVTLSASDQDADGVIDANDNCPVLPNSDQSDMDSDNTGDLCDIDPDGDGSPGISGIPFESGRALVETACLSCHNSGIAGVPQFNDVAAWDVRIAQAGGQPEDMLDSVLNGKGSMPGFADRYSAQELIQAIRYLSGREDLGGTPGGGVADQDRDGVPDASDNCPKDPNTDQLDSDRNGVGNACEPLADRDGDGYPLKLDDDDGNASRLIATLPEATGSNNTVFSSANAQPMRLGRVAIAVAESSGFARAAVVLSENEFAQGVSRVFPGVSAASDTQGSSLMGVTNLIITTADTGEAEVIIQLSANLPLNPVVRLFDTSSGLWSDFSTGASGQLASAPIANINCPNSNSSNYQDGLISGLTCVRVRVQDGDANDADGTINGHAELMINIASSTLLDPNGPPATVDTDPSKGGGGATGPWLLALLLFRYLIAVLLPFGAMLRNRE